jgi:outer membrane immunogenic protein
MADQRPRRYPDAHTPCALLHTSRVYRGGTVVMHRAPRDAEQMEAPKMRPMVWMFVALAVLASAPAQAQDWSGPYSGLHAGYSSVKPEFTEPVYEPAGLNPGVGGFAGGALFGYRGRRIGVEAEVGISRLGATEPSGDDGFTEFQSDWVSRARLLLNRSVGNTLLFGAVGVAAMRFYVDDAYVEPANDPALVHDPRFTTLAGWTIGAGIERAIRPRIGARIEAIYDRYGGKDLSDNPGEGRIEPSSMTIRGALVFRF